MTLVGVTVRIFGKKLGNELDIKNRYADPLPVREVGTIVACRDRFSDPNGNQLAVIPVQEFLDRNLAIKVVTPSVIFSVRILCE